MSGVVEAPLTICNNESVQSSHIQSDPSNSPTQGTTMHGAEELPFRMESSDTVLSMSTTEHGTASPELQEKFSHYLMSHSEFICIGVSG